MRTQKNTKTKTGAAERGARFLFRNKRQQKKQNKTGVRAQRLRATGAAEGGARAGAQAAARAGCANAQRSAACQQSGQGIEKRKKKKENGRKLKK